MKRALRGASGIALLFGVVGLAPAQAQQAAPPSEPKPQTVNTTQTPPAAPGAPQAGPTTTRPAAATEENRVVVTGSLIATRPEDGTKPVEVYTRQELEEQGSPSINEFLRDLPIAYETAGLGEAIPGGAAATGFNSANLRGLGPNATLVLLNGRRLASTNGGSGADVNTLPSGALQAVEVLKGGASTTYGAGAVGGVINYITRRDIDAPEITLAQRFWADSYPETQLTFLTGWVGDAGNIMVDYEYDHTPRLRQNERDYASLPYLVNPEVYTLDPSNPGRYSRVQNFFSSTAPTIPASPSADRVIYDYDTRANCNAIGGEVNNITQPNRQLVAGSYGDLGCSVPQYMYEDLVNESTSHKVYIESNLDINENMKFHIEGLYSKTQTDARGVPFPTSSNSNRGVIALPGSAGVTTTGTTTASAASASLCGLTGTGCTFMIPVSVPTYTTAGVLVTTVGSGSANPFIADFMARGGSATSPGRTTPLTLGSNDALFTGVGWRPFGFGGNPSEPDGLFHNNTQRERFQVNAALSGKFAEGTFFGFLKDINYSYSAQYNYYDQSLLWNDIIVSRLQDALMGYGGADCLAKDRVATDYTNATTYDRTVGIQSDQKAGTTVGVSKCEWFNPFASGPQTSVANGAANPWYNPNLPQNSAALTSWLFNNRVDELQNTSATFDATWNGEIPALELPGGKIGWAAGVQWRSLESRSGVQPQDGLERTLQNQLCPYPDPSLISKAVAIATERLQAPGDTGCSLAAPPGPFLGFGTTTLSYSDEQAIGYYAEFQFPVLDSVNLNASWRREEFNGGDLTGDIWSVSGKWDITDNFYVRADYGTNFRAQGLGVVPGSVTVSASGALLCCSSRFGSASGIVPQIFTVTDTNIGPENDTTANIGGGFKFNDLWGASVSGDLTFFENIIDGDLVGDNTTPLTIVLNSVYGASTGAAKNVLGSATNPGAGAVGCNSPLLGFLIFDPTVNGGECVDGLTPGHTLGGTHTVVTSGNQIVGIIRVQQNGGGFITNGLDYKFDASYPLFDGRLGLSIQATQTLAYKVHGYDIGGIPFAQDGNRLGYRNQNLGSGANNSREWRAQASLRWSNTVHTANLTANYASGVRDAGYAACGPPAVTLEQFYTCGDSLTAVNVDSNGTVLTGIAGYSTYGVAAKEQLTFNATYIWRPKFDWSKGLELRTSIINLTDKDPIGDQTRRGFSTGDPRGRIFELEIKKTF